MAVQLRVNWPNKGSPTKNLAPQAIPIFQPGGDKIELKEPANNINDNEKEDKPALSINCEMTENGKNIKKYLESVVKTPLKYVRLRHVGSGKVLTDDAPLMKLGPAFAIDLELESEDPEKHPIAPKRRVQRTETIDSDILAVNVPDDGGSTPRQVEVEIVVQKGSKAFLGGFKNNKTGSEYHHAITQTVEGKRKDWNQIVEDTTSRVIQTMPTKSSYQQTDIEKGTQTATSGFHVCTGDDKEVTGSPKRYVKAADHKILQIKAIIKIQRMFRRYRKRKDEAAAKKALIENQSYDMFEYEDTDLEMEEDAGVESGETDSREELQRLYAQLENWRLSEEKRIMTTTRQASRLRSARAKLVTDEALKLAQLANKRDKNKLAHKQDIVKSIILKAGQPKVWFNNAGRMLQLETPGTLRARELGEIYMILASDADEDGAEGEERLPALHSLAGIIGELDDCPLADELLTLVEREEEMVKRGVKASNLAGIRQRILTKFLQLVRSPDHNPEIARFEKQLPVPVLHSARSGTRKQPPSVEFCMSCRRHLPKIKFKSSKESSAAAAAAGETGGSAGEGRPSTTGTVSIGKCVNCERLDNNARTRQDLSVYKSMLNRIRRDEEARFNMTSPIFQLQDSDIRYIVRSLWDSRSILCGLSDLYELRLVRWNRGKEWSPWNCILLTKDEAELHMHLDNLNKAYGNLLLQKILAKHTLARNHFSKMPSMAKYFQVGTTNLKAGRASSVISLCSSVSEMEQENVGVSGTAVSLK